MENTEKNTDVNSVNRDDDVTNVADFIYGDADKGDLPSAIQDAVDDVRSVESVEVIEGEVVEGEVVDSPDPDIDYKQPRPIELFSNQYYEQQPDEDNVRYQKFLTFASQPSEKRTVQRAWEIWAKERRDLKEGDHIPRVPNSFYNTSRHWRWQERSHALDIQRMKLAEQIWIERDVERREEDWGIGNDVRKKAVTALNGLDTDDLSPGMILKYLEVASNLQRDAVPSMKLNQNQLKSLITSLPEERRGRVIRILMAEVTDA